MNDEFDFVSRNEPIQLRIGAPSLRIEAAPGQCFLCVPVESDNP